jgi:1-acyl-sn-glycerol-3-phosphate acyltransferase
VQLFRVVVGWLVTLPIMPLILLVLMVTPAHKRLVIGAHMARFWGRIMLAICGIRLDIRPAAAAVLAERAPRVMTLNHTSTLDFVVGGAIYPEGCVIIAKREIEDLFLLGPVTRRMSMIFIDRSDPATARASLKAAAERIHSERLVVLIAPEGTRSRDGRLARFKAGAFWLAQIADVPVVPLVWKGCREIWPMGQFGPHSGTIVIDALPPMRVGPGEDAPRQAADALRAQYLEALGMDDDAQAAPAAAAAP